MRNLLIFLIISFADVFSWPFQEEFNKLNTAIEDGGKRIAGYVNNIDAKATFIFDSVKDYVENQQTKITDSFNQYVDAVEEKQRMIEEEFDNYVKTVKETGRRATDTFSIFNENIDDINPDLHLDAPNMMERNGYICETHAVISQGYVLNIHRIPKSNSSDASGKTVILQHGLFGSSVDWILNGPGRGLAYVLSDAGYDVWMSNIRGNKYSREHKKLSTDSEEYWNFSWHDVAYNDVPKIIDYIKELKGPDSELAYLGHSMGTTILFAMLATKPEYNAILTAGYALAPEVFFTNFKSPIKPLASIASDTAYVENLYGSHEFLPKNSALGRLTGVCSTDSFDSDVCRNVLFYICGSDEAQFNKTLLPVFLSHLGTGTSWRTIVHFSQLILSGKFQQFDYGYSENLLKYGSFNPPEYDLDKITLPVSLFWSENDLLSSEEDVMLLKNKLKTKMNIYKVPDPKFNHLDYLWAIDVKGLLNDQILEYMKTDFKGGN